MTPQQQLRERILALLWDAGRGLSAYEVHSLLLSKGFYTADQLGIFWVIEVLHYLFEDKKVAVEDQHYILPQFTVKARLAKAEKELEDYHRVAEKGLRLPADICQGAAYLALLLERLEKNQGDQ